MILVLLLDVCRENFQLERQGDWAERTDCKKGEMLRLSDSSVLPCLTL